MKFFPTIILTIGVAILLSACTSTPKVNIDFNENTNFQPLKSFQFVQVKGNSANPIMDNRIEQEIKKQLIAKQFDFLTRNDTSQNNADLTIKFAFTQQEVASNSSFNIGIGGAKIGSHGGVGVSTNVPITPSSKILSTIIIDISHNEQPIWHGNTGFEGIEKMNSVEKDAAIATTVAKLLAQFPPKS